MNLLANPEVTLDEGPEVMPQENPHDYEQLIKEYGLSDRKVESIIIKHLQEKDLKPYQAELIKLQQLTTDTATDSHFTTPLYVYAMQKVTVRAERTLKKRET